MRKTLLILILLLPGRWFVASLLYGQADAFHDWHRWARFTTAQGLPSNQIRTLRESSSGVPWTITSEGLAYFDGYEWKRIAVSEHAVNSAYSYLESGEGDSMLVVNAGNLYYGTERGFRILRRGSVLKAAFISPSRLVALFDSSLNMREKGTWIAVPALANVRVLNMWRTSGGSVWASTEIGLQRWNGNVWESKLPADRESQLVHALDEDEWGNALASVGIPISQRGLWEWTNHGPASRSRDEQGDFIISLVLRPDEAIAAHQSGEVRLRYQGKWRSLDPLPSQLENTTTLTSRKNNDLWVGTVNGLFLFRKQSIWTYHRLPISTPANRIHEIVRARDGTLWSATAGGLVIYRRDGTAELIEKIGDRRLFEVTGLAEDDSGRIWISSGYAFDGAYRWNGKEWKYFSVRSDSGEVRIHRIRKDRQGNLWFLGMASRSQITSDSQPGAFKFDGRSFVRWGTGDGLLHGRVYAFSEGPDGSYWFGTLKGLSRWKQGTWSHWTQERGLISPRIFSVYADGNGVWFSDQFNGLGRVDGEGRISYLTERDGLIDNEVWDLSGSPDGALWITTKSGLMKYQDHAFSIFNSQTGLSNVRLWPVLPESGKILVGTLGSGIAVLDLHSVQRRSPSIRGDEIITEGGKLGLEWKVFSYWGRLATEEIQTRIRVDGGSWSDWSKNKKAHFDTLAWGSHQYQIQARGLYGDMSENRAVSFEIPPPLYARLWFILPVLGLLALVVYLSVSLYRRKRRSHEDLRASELKLRALLEHGTQGILLFNAAGEVTYVAHSILGYDLAYWARENAWSFIHPKDLHQVRAVFQAILAEPGKLGRVEFRARHRDGSWRWLEAAGKNLLREPSVGALVVNYVETTERKGAEEHLLESERKYRAIVEGTQAMLFTTDRRGILTYVNDAAVNVLGVPAENLIGTFYLKYVDREDRERVHSLYWKQLASAEHYTYLEFRYHSGSGNAGWMSFFVNPIVRDGTVIGLTGVAQEITERKLAEITLRESQQRLQESLAFLRQLFASLPTIAFITTDLRLRVTSFSPGAEIIFGCSPEESVGTSLEQFFTEGDAGLIRQISSNIIDGSEGESLEMILMRRDGKDFHAHCIFSPIRTSSDEPSALLFVAQDVSHRKIAERAVFESEQKFRATFEQAAVGISHQAINGQWMRINQKFCDILGYTRDELVTLSFQRVTHPDDLDADLQLVNRLVSGEMPTYSREKRYIRKDGSTVWVNLTATLIRDEEGAPLYFIDVVEDISERKRVESALRESEERYRIVAETATDAIITIDSQSTILFVNRAAEKIFGYSQDEMRGQSLTMLMPEYLRHLHMAGITNYLETHSRHLSWEAISLPGLHKSGKEVPLEVSFGEFTKDGKHLFSGIVRDVSERRRIEDQLREQAALLDKAQEAIYALDFDQVVQYWNLGSVRTYGWSPEQAVGRKIGELLKDERQRDAALKSVLADDEWKGELTQTTQSGMEIIVQSHWSLVRDDRGNPRSVLVINSDITDRKKLEAQFLRSQRMESIGTLAGGIAHDLNNVLAPILMSVKLLAERSTDGESIQILKTLELSAVRGADLIKQVLTFARGASGERSLVRPDQMMIEVQKILRETFPRSIRITSVVDDDVWSVIGDVTQLHQVLMNLCVNGRDAMPAGGELRVRMSNAVFTERDVRTLLDVKPGKYLIIEVQDTGKGIPPEIITKIFDPFFTTKEIGKGTGLGLSTVRAIVKGHGGSVNVTSQVGVGTIFTVHLPAVQTDAPDPAAIPEKTIVTGAGQVVMVIDDEESILQITKATLESYGYKVLTAIDGIDAISVFADSTTGIDIVLTDMMMPNLGGAETIRVLRQMDPRVKIIASSGVTVGDRLSEVRNFVNGFIAKPYTADALLKTISEVINQSPSDPREVDRPK